MDSPESLDGFMGWRRGQGLGSGDVLLNEALDQRAEGLAGLGQDEALCRQIELETCASGRDPDLLDGGIGGDDKFACRFFEDDVQRALLLFHFEFAFVFGGVEILLQLFDGRIGCFAKLNFVDHSNTPFNLRQVYQFDLFFAFGRVRV